MKNKIAKQISHIKMTRHNISSVGDKNGEILINKTET